MIVAGNRRGFRLPLTRRSRMSAALACLALVIVMTGSPVARAAGEAAPASSPRQSASAGTAGTAGTASTVSANAALIARGRYLAVAGDCAACHKAPDGTPFAGGAPLNSPFGAIYASNITPDPHAGIGGYTLEEFDRALREGVARGGKRLYPAMPYPSFAKLNAQDVQALYAYFMHGVQPVSRVPQASHLPFPFNQRWALFFWDKLFANHERFTIDPKRDAQWNRGAYLVQGLGHCGACHTPRGVGFEERGYSESSSHYLSGALNDNWFAPNLSGAQGGGLGRWSERDIVDFLQSGRGHGEMTFGSMTQTISESLRHLSPDDLAAMAHYLKSLPAHGDDGRYDPVQGGAGLTERTLREGANEPPGAAVYAGFCARCHQVDGRDVTGHYPSLAGASLLLARDPSSVIRLILEGDSSLPAGEASPHEPMPAFGEQLSDEQIAQVTTFIRNGWGNQASPVTPREVRTLRNKLAK